MFERFSDRARKVMALANQEAQRFGHEYIGTEHVLLGLVKEGSGVGANVLKNCDIDLRKVRVEVEKLVKSGWGISAGKLRLTPRVKNVIEFAILEMRDRQQDYVGTEHLLLGLLKEERCVAYTVLSGLGLSLDRARAGVVELWEMGWKDDSKLSTADPRIAALAQLLLGRSPGNPQPDGCGGFDFRAVDSGVVITHQIASQMKVSSADLEYSAQSQAARVLRATAERLEKVGADLREFAARLEA